MTSPLMEFHPSMSLENHLPPAPIEINKGASNSTTEAIHSPELDNQTIWQDVDQTLQQLDGLQETLCKEEKEGLKKLHQLKKLHSICHILFHVKIFYQML
ncbi:hypothetical protein THRCLA_23447 [Thraustotheca clavata]|uniref:Uncharacterized protein n=1 Tax=Thraustotheca clavata TaxID=74557 RepID=A0A1V9Y4J6_9STRA|nr:hypothetical protein THRCLA_23447 [Thraustotheca clavata]